MHSNPIHHSFYDAQAGNQAVLAIAESSKQRMIASVTDWRQEDYHGFHQTLYVTRQDGSKCWEVWNWRPYKQPMLGRFECPTDMIDELKKNGLDKLATYKVIASLAVCVQRTNAWEEVNRH